MNENLIEEIVSDCGYEALGLYEYLYSIRDKKYDVTIISMYQIADKGAYFDTHTLLESMGELKVHGYLMTTGCMYIFPRVVENYDKLLDLFSQMDGTNPDNFLKSINENSDYQELVIKSYRAYQEDKEMGYC